MGVLTAQRSDDVQHLDRDVLQVAVTAAHEESLRKVRLTQDRLEVLWGFLPIAEQIAVNNM